MKSKKILLAALETVKLNARAEFTIELKTESMFLAPLQIKLAEFTQFPKTSHPIKCKTFATKNESERVL